LVTENFSPKNPQNHQKKISIFKSNKISTSIEKPQNFNAWNEKVLNYGDFFMFLIWFQIVKISVEFSEFREVFISYEVQRGKGKLNDGFHDKVCYWRWNLTTFSSIKMGGRMNKPNLSFSVSRNSLAIFNFKKQVRRRKKWRHFDKYSSIKKMKIYDSKMWHCENLSKAERGKRRVDKEMNATFRQFFMLSKMENSFGIFLRKLMFFTLFGVEKYAKTLEETFPFFLYKFWGFWDFATKLFGKLNFSIPNLIHLLIQCIVLDDDTFFLTKCHCG
jgi:hypothetical protein